MNGWTPVPSIGRYTVDLAVDGAPIGHAPLVITRRQGAVGKRWRSLNHPRRIVRRIELPRPRSPGPDTYATDSSTTLEQALESRHPFEASIGGIDPQLLAYGIPMWHRGLKLIESFVLLT